MKKIVIGMILLIAVFKQTAFYAQERYDVILKNDTVYNNGVPQFICKLRSSDKGNVYSLRSMDDKLQGLLVWRVEGINIKFSGNFPELKLRYSCLYPKMEILTLMESYVRNKVMVKGVANLQGLQDYCKERNIPLEPLTRKKDTAKRDSTLAAIARADALNQVKFVFHNNSKMPARVFIGDKLKGSGRIQVIPAGGDLNEHARKTEKIFLINTAGDEIVSLKVSDSLKRIVINAKGDGFE